MPAIVQAAHSSRLNRLSSFRLLLRDCYKFGDHTFFQPRSFFARLNIQSIPLRRAKRRPCASRLIRYCLTKRYLLEHPEACKLGHPPSGRSSEHGGVRKGCEVGEHGSTTCIAEFL